MGNLLKAEEFYLKSLKIRQNLLGENHSDVAMYYINLGVLYHNMGNLPKAEEFYLKSLKIRQNLFGENHPNVATSYNNLGGLYDNMGNLPKAEECGHVVQQFRKFILQYGKFTESRRISFEILENL